MQTTPLKRLYFPRTKPSMVKPALMTETSLGIQDMQTFTDKLAPSHNSCFHRSFISEL